MEMLSECAEIVYRQWTEDVFDYSGKHFSVKRCRALPKPLQSESAPLIIGGSTRTGTARLAAQFAFEYNTTAGATPEACRKRRAHLDEACLAVGRTPSTLGLSVMTELILGRDAEGVQRRLEQIARLQGLRDAQAFLDSDGMGGRSMAIGVPEDIICRLREYEAAGVRRVIFQHLLHEDMESLELLLDVVLPTLASKIHPTLGS